MFASGRRKPIPAAPLPPPAGFEVDPLASIRASGANITSGYRSPQHNAKVGGVPGSDHLNADALDLTPAKGQSWGDLHSLADAVAKARGGKVIDESRTRKPHIHLSLPGWGGAPGLPPPPAGFSPVGAAPKPSAVPTAALGAPNGKVHDGDTFGLTSGANARLLGVDAFELNQQGRSPSGAMIPLGQAAKQALTPFAVPGAAFAPNGSFTYGRPVGTLDNGGDAGRSLLRQGNALAAPQYLQNDPARLSQYMEAERLARLNQLGAHGNSYQTPSSFRAGNPDPWAKPEQSTDGKGVAVFADEPTPFQGLRPEIEQGYLGIWNDPQSKPEDLLAYAKSNGFKISEGEVRKKYAKRFKDGDTPDAGVEYAQPPKLLTDLGDGRFGASLRGFADPINMLDEMGGVADSLIPGAAIDGPRENVWNSDRRFGDILWNNIDQNRAILGNDEATHPYYRLGGQLAAGVVAPIGGGARTIPQLARLGAIEGGLAGFGAGEGNMLQRAPNAAAGAALGGVGGAALGGLIQVAPGVWRRLAGREADAAGDDLGTIGQAAYEAAPVVDDGLQQAGPTPAARSQPRAGVAGFGADDFRRAAADIEAKAPPVVPDHVRLWKATNGRNYTTDLAGVALPVRNGRGGDLGYIDVPAEDLPLYALDGTRSEYRLPTALGGYAKSVRLADDSPWGGSAAMRMDDEAPELVGQIPPPPPGFLPEPLGNMQRVGDAMTPEQLAQGARQIEPGQVLPVPRNYVSSLEETQSARPFSVQPIEAVDEFGTLETRRFPTPTGTRHQRGPVDLVGFMRSQGGLRDEGGELTHLGISNARRNDDFTGAETFLGRLVNKDGMALDEAAHKAWETGYFPDHAEPPSASEFLDALNSTYRGFNRRFLPEDMGELSRFESVRGQREAVESAAQDGRTLAEDLGRPVGPDDLDAMQPPVSAYEDLSEEIKRVGNIDVSKLETPNDIAQALTAINRAFGNEGKAVSHAETEKLADEMGLTVEGLMRLRKGQAVNHAEAFASRRLLAASLNDTVGRARKAIGGSDADKADFMRSLMMSAAIRQKVAGATAEAGRALSQFRMIAKASKRQSDMIRDIIDGKGGPRSIDNMAEALIELERDPAAANRFIQKAAKPGFKDMFNEYFINSLVSGPRTHAVNIISNLATAALQLPEHALAAGVGLVRRGTIDRLPIGGRAGETIRRNATDRVLVSELGSRFVGMLQGARSGLANARFALKTGRAVDDTHKVEARFQHAIPGPLGHVVRIPTRLLTAEDEFFKGMNFGGELAGLAKRKAVGEGLKGDALKARIAELNANPDDAMMTQARDAARYLTFQRRLGPLGSKISQATNEVPGLKVIIPFVRTPTNLLKFAMERSPAAPLLKGWRDDFAAGGSRRDLAIARAAAGSGLGMLAASWAAEGTITGGGPADENARRILMADGWQPYSIKIGGKYYSYQRLDPLASTLGIAADYVDKSSKMTERQADEQALTITSSIISNMSDKVWLQGIADLAQAIDDPERYGESYVRRTLTGLAVPVGVSQLAQTIDPQQREAKTIGEQFQSRIPGLSDNLRPRLDAWGRPMLKEGAVGPDIVSPFYQSTRRDEAINLEALRLNLKVSDPSRTVAGRRLSDAEFHAYRMKAGGFVSYEFNKLVASPEWQGLSDAAKRDRFDALKKSGREAAREALGLAHGEDGQEVAIPPPPPGFALAE